MRDTFTAYPEQGRKRRERGAGKKNGTVQGYPEKPVKKEPRPYRTVQAGMPAQENTRLAVMPSVVVLVFIVHIRPQVFVTRCVPHIIVTGP